MLGISKYFSVLWWKVRHQQNVFNREGWKPCWEDQTSSTQKSLKQKCHFRGTPCSNRIGLDLGFGLIRIGQCWTDTLRKWSLRCRKHYIISSLINTISFYEALPLQWKWKNWNRLFTLYSTALRYYINLISKNPLENSLRKMKFMFLPFKFIIELTASTLHWETKFEKCHL